MHESIEKQKQAVSAEIGRIKRSPFPLRAFPISDAETMSYRGGDENYYFHGKSAGNLVDGALQLLYREKSDIETILDFPCGHGRVLRALRSSFPESRICACDLDRKGVDFCASTFNAQGVYSNPELEVNFDELFDLIWCGSLLTHIDKDDWERFIQFFSRNMKDGGILIFTYAGSYVKELVKHGDHDYVDQEEATGAVRDYEFEGFGFMQYNTHDYKYGRTICSPLWVRSFLDKHCTFRVLMHCERGWGARQDVVVCVK